MAPLHGVPVPYMHGILFALAISHFYMACSGKQLQIGC